MRAKMIWGLVVALAGFGLVVGLMVVLDLADAPPPPSPPAVATEQGGVAVPPRASARHRDPIDCLSPAPPTTAPAAASSSATGREPAMPGVGAAPTRTDTRRLSGRVVDEAGAPVGSGRVVLVRDDRRVADAVVDAGGEFHFERVRAGEITVVALPVAHAPARRSLTLSVPGVGDSGEASPLTIVVPDGRTIVVRTVDDRGAAVPGVAVRWFDPGTSLGRRGSSDSAGRVTLRGLPPSGEVAPVVRATKPGYFAERAADGDVLRASARGAAGEATIRMVEAATVCGRIVDAAGRPVPDALVYVDRSDWTWSRIDGPAPDERVGAVSVCPTLWTRTEGNGEFRLDAFPPLDRVPLTVRVERPGASRVTTPVTRWIRVRAGGERTDVVIRVGGGAVLTGVVQGPGAPIAGATVVVARAERICATARTDAQGCFVVSGLAAGAYEVRAADPDGLVGSVVRVTLARRAVRTIRLAAGIPVPPIAGIVRDADGRGVAGVTVTANGTDTPGLFLGETFWPLTATTDGAGRFRFGKTRPGWRYRLAAEDASGRTARTGPVSPGAVDVQLRLERASGRLRVLVAGGASDLHVVVAPSDGGEARTARWRDGGLAFDRLPPGPAVVRVVDATGVVVAGPVEAAVVADRTTAVRLAVATLDLIGIVVDAAGRPLPGAHVSALVAGAQGIVRRAARANAKGRVVLRDLRNRAVDVAIAVPRAGFMILTGVATRGGNTSPGTPTLLRFAPNATLRLSVVAADDGGGVAGASVGLMSRGRAGFRTTADAAGQVVLRVNRGSFALVVVADGYEPSGQRISIGAADRVRDLRVALVRRQP